MTTTIIRSHFNMVPNAEDMHKVLQAAGITDVVISSITGTNPATITSNRALTEAEQDAVRAVVLASILTFETVT